MNNSYVYTQTELIKRMLREIKQEMRKYEEDDAYREYCEGIIESAIAVLGVIRP